MASPNLVDMILAARQGKSQGANQLPPELLDRLRQTLMNRQNPGQLDQAAGYAATGGGGGGPDAVALQQEMQRRAAMQAAQQFGRGRPNQAGGEYGTDRMGYQGTPR